MSLYTSTVFIVLCVGHGYFRVDREHGHVPQMSSTGDSVVVLSLAALPSTHRQQLPLLGTARWWMGYVSSPMTLWSVQHGWIAVGGTSVALHQSTMPSWHHQVLSAHLVASILNLMISVFQSTGAVSGTTPAAHGGGSASVDTTVGLLPSTTSLYLDLSRSAPSHHLGGWSLSLLVTVQSEMASASGIVSSLSIIM